MGKLIAEAVFLLALPTVIFLGGVRIMTNLSGHEYVERLRDKLALDDQTSLNQRFMGYDLAAVKRHWQPLASDKLALQIEQRFLELDLVFPLFYGSAFAISLLLAWTALDRPFNPVWIIAPVAITILADWIENLSQLNQLNRVQQMNDVEALQGGWIQVASLATMVKLFFFSGLIVFLMTLIVWLFYASKRS